jgi:hypothetical protein
MSPVPRRRAVCGTLLATEDSGGAGTTLSGPAEDHPRPQARGRIRSSQPHPDLDLSRQPSTKPRCLLSGKGPPTPLRTSTTPVGNRNRDYALVANRLGPRAPEFVPQPGLKPDLAKAVTREVVARQRSRGAACQSPRGRPPPPGAMRPHVSSRRDALSGGRGRILIWCLMAAIAGKFAPLTGAVHPHFFVGAKRTLEHGGFAPLLALTDTPLGVNGYYLERVGGAPPVSALFSNRGSSCTSRPPGRGSRPGSPGSTWR